MLEGPAFPEEVILSPVNPEETNHSTGSVIHLIPVRPEINHGSGSVRKLVSMGWELLWAVSTQKTFTIREKVYLK